MNLPFKEYLNLGKVKQKTPDPEEAAALLQQAQERILFAQEKKITEKAAKFVLEQAYEAIREAVQSLMSKQGFKPYSHEATVSYLPAFYSSDFTQEEIHLFDY